MSGLEWFLRFDHNGFEFDPFYSDLTALQSDLALNKSPACLTRGL
jgi:hypothetical protein